MEEFLHFILILFHFSFISGFHFFSMLKPYLTILATLKRGRECTVIKPSDQSTIKYCLTEFSSKKISSGITKLLQNFY